MTAENPFNKGRSQDTIPTRDAYLANPRSSQLRTYCIAIATNLDALMFDPEAVTGSDKQRETTEALKIIGKELQQLGIAEGMHAGIDARSIFKDPIMATEWVAASLLPHLNRPAVSIASILENEIPEEAAIFARLNRTLGLSYGLLDAAEAYEASETLIGSSLSDNPIVTSYMLSIRNHGIPFS